jgi:hypothetical protein
MNLKLHIFKSVPWRVKLRTVLAPLMGSTAEKVMAPAVADDALMGYTKL